MRWGMRLALSIVPVFGLQAALAAGLRIEPRVYLEEFRLRSAGPPLVDGWMREERDAAGLLSASGCRALGFACDDGDADAVIRYMRPLVAAARYRGTATPVRIRGDRTYAKFTAPPGFTTCRAGIFLKDGAISPGATFAGAIQRSGRDGLAVYADLGSGGEPRFIEFKLMIEYVAANGGDRAACWPDLTLVFLCGAEGCRSGPAYPQTSLR